MEKKRINQSGNLMGKMNNNKNIIHLKTNQNMIKPFFDRAIALMHDFIRECIRYHSCISSKKAAHEKLMNIIPNAEFN